MLVKFLAKISLGFAFNITLLIGTGCAFVTVNHWNRASVKMVCGASIIFELPVTGEAYIQLRLRVLESQVQKQYFIIKCKSLASVFVLVLCGNLEIGCGKQIKYGELHTICKNAPHFQDICMFIVTEY